jgi:hypothetical protein
MTENERDQVDAGVRVGAMKKLFDAALEQHTAFATMGATEAMASTRERLHAQLDAYLDATEYGYVVTRRNMGLA